MVDDASSNADGGQDLLPATPEQEHSFGELRRYVPQDLLDVSFPVSVRGYERRAVDAHIKRVNRVIAELKVRSSPTAAVRHALDQAEEKVQRLLQAGREAAEEITANAQQEAEESTARAKAEAAELLVNTNAEAERVKAESNELIANARTEANEMLAAARAEAESTVARAEAEADERRQRLQEELAALRAEAEMRRREIEADTEAVWKERGELLEDIRRMAGGLVDLATAAAARIQRREPSGLEDEIVEFEGEAEPEPREVATRAPARAMPTVAREDGSDEPREK